MTLYLECYRQKTFTFLNWKIVTRSSTLIKAKPKLFVPYKFPISGGEAEDENQYRTSDVENLRYFIYFSWPGWGNDWVLVK